MYNQIIKRSDMIMEATMHCTCEKQCSANRARPMNYYQSSIHGAFSVDRRMETEVDASE
jgi:hypothetical protein